MREGRAKAVFVDRDGVLNEMVFNEDHGIMDSPRRVEQVVAMPGAGPFLKGLRELGYLIVVVTNQPGVAKGSLGLDDLDAVNGELARQLGEQGGRWDALYFCPHHPDPQPNGNADYVMACECRKPKPGLLTRAAEELGIALKVSWMLGDGLTDVQAGRSAGCRTILLAKVKIEHVERFMNVEGAEPDHVAGDLAAALEAIRGS